MMTQISPQRQSLRDDTNHYRQELVRVLRDYLAAKNAMDAHITDTNNPHGVDRYQLGLEYLENFAIADGADVVSGSSATLYVRPTQLGDALHEHIPQPTATSYIRTPRILSPQYEEPDISTTPTIEATPYTYIQASTVVFSHREIQIDVVEGDWSSPIAEWTSDGTGETVSPTTLSPGVQYKVRLRDHSTGTLVSEWTPSILFTTAAE